MFVGRNAPCTCGSGKKFKKCCGSRSPFDGQSGQSLNPAEPGAETETATVDAERAVELTFGNKSLAQSLFSLQGLLAVLREELGAPTARVWRIASEEITDDHAVVRVKLDLARQLLGVRLREQLLDVVDAINRTRTLALAQAVRAAVETAGAIVYYRRKFIDSVDDQAALRKQLDRCLLGSRFPWDEWQRLRGPGSASGLADFSRRLSREKPKISEDAPPSVMTFVDYLQRRWVEQAREKGRGELPLEGQVLVIYQQLCDFVHPSIGSWKTFVGTDERSLEVRVDPSSQIESLRFVWFFFGQFVTELSFIGYADLLDLDGKGHKEG